MGLIESEKMQRSAKTPIKGKGHWTLNDKPTLATLLGHEGNISFMTLVPFYSYCWIHDINSVNKVHCVDLSSAVYVRMSAASLVS